MGRHSKPDPGDSLPEREPEPFDEPVDEPQYGGDDYQQPAAADDYPDFGYRPSAPEPAAGVESPVGEPAAETPPPPPFRASHRGLRDWQGGHRSVGGRRGVSI